MYRHSSFFLFGTCIKRKITLDAIGSDEETSVSKFQISVYTLYEHHY